MTALQLTDQGQIFEYVIKNENDVINQLLLPKRHTFKLLPKNWSVKSDHNSKWVIGAGQKLEECMVLTGKCS